MNETNEKYISATKKYDVIDVISILTESQEYTLKVSYRIGKKSR
jgi:hypothetical protein